jgi:hypothetical protein
VGSEVDKADAFACFTFFVFEVYTWGETALVRLLWEQCIAGVL